STSARWGIRGESRRATLEELTHHAQGNYFSQTAMPGSAAEATVPLTQRQGQGQRQGLRVSRMRRRQTQVLPGRRRSGPAARSADHEALAHQERLDDSLDGV